MWRAANTTSSSAPARRSRSRAKTCRHGPKCWSCRSGIIDAALLTRLARGQHLARPRRVFIHLGDKRFGAVEFCLAAKEMHKRDLGHLAVKIALKIEEMNLKQRRPIVEG